jgi:hypothetical protein
MQMYYRLQTPRAVRPSNIGTKSWVLMRFELFECSAVSSTGSGQCVADITFDGGSTTAVETAPEIAGECENHGIGRLKGRISSTTMARLVELDRNSISEDSAAGIIVPRISRYQA